MRTMVFFVLLTLILLPTMTLADVPGLISYQGTLTDDSGVALDTTVSMTFTIYVDSTGPNFVWTETQSSVGVHQGLFNVLLGRVNPIPETVFDWLTCWLSVRVGIDPALQPRQRMASVGYSFRAAEADTADYARSAAAASDGDWTVSGIHQYSAVSGNVGVGISSPSEKLHIYYGNVQISGDDDYNMSLLFDDEDTGNEFSIIGHQHLKLSTNGIARLAISTAGDVGIGTTLPLARLHVVGSGGNYGYMGHGGYGVYGNSPSSYAVYGYSSGGFGVHGYSGGSYGSGGSHSSGNSGYLGTSTYGVAGSHNGGNYGRLGTSSEGVHGYSSGSTGVFGSSSTGRGVQGHSGGYGVWGSHSGGNYGYLGGGTYSALGYHSGGNFGYLGSSDYGAYGFSSINYGVYGYSSGGYGVRGEHADGNYGFMGSSSYGVYGHYDNTNYGYLGSSSYGMRAGSYEPSTGTVGAFGYHGNATDGTGYRYDSTMCGIVGRCAYGTDYHCGVQGLSYSGDVGNRTSGVQGRFLDQTGYWGSLAYKTSANNLYGGYFTSYVSGPGKESPGIEACTGVGLGSWGDLFGADIHGKVYGVYAEGGDYALYSHGTVFKDDLDVHLQHDRGEGTSVLYTNVSTDVTVQTSGFATLSGGKSFIRFEQDFEKAVSPDVAIVVTVTPTGDCNGVHVSGVTTDGFTVVENNAGKSSVQVAFIAVGRRAGYEDPKLPTEVVSAQYVEKLSRGLHNDGDTRTDGEGLFFKDGELVVGVHPSTRPDPNKPAEELEQLEHAPPPEIPPNPPADDVIRQPSQGNVVPERARTKQSD